MSGRVDNLDSKRQRAVIALLTHPTISKAAAAARMGESTLRRWLRSPDFRVALRTAGREALEYAVSRLQDGTADAAEALRRNLKAGKPSERTRAAQVLLDAAFRGTEFLDLAGRLEAVEALLEARDTE